jgi:hypothetical protein
MAPYAGYSEYGPLVALPRRRRVTGGAAHYRAGGRRVNPAMMIAVAAASLAVLAALCLHQLKGPPLIDFQGFYSAAETPTDGRAIYGCALKWRDAGYSWFQPGQPFPCEPGEGLYMYPPAFAVAIAPLALLPRPTAEVVWHLASYLMLAAAIVVLTRA